MPIDHSKMVPLVESRRGKMVESLHFGSFAVVDHHGKTLVSAGSTDAPIYARSSLKPLQSTAMVRAGLSLPQELIALSSASHSGEKIHIDGVKNILDLHGLSEDDLLNIEDYPYGVEQKIDWARAGKSRSRIAQNCSGKHAALLATCVINGWSTKDYLNPSHPLQNLIRQTVGELTEEEPTADTFDGCGTPLFANSLRSLAYSYARISVAPANSAESQVVEAIRKFPQMLAGEERDVTALMRAVPQLIAKDGAEGVQLVGLAEGIGIAIKISDGSDRARLPITLALLEHLGIPTEMTSHIIPTPVLGGGTEVGKLRAYPAAIPR